MTDKTDDLCARLEAVEWSGKSYGRPIIDNTTCWYRNPDGPEAATRIREQEADLRAIEAALSRPAMDRDEVARIIDPVAADIAYVEGVGLKWREAPAKADAILALLPIDAVEEPRP